MDEVKNLSLKIVDYFNEASNNKYPKFIMDKDIYNILNKFYTKALDDLEREIRDEYENEEYYY